MEISRNLVVFIVFLIIWKETLNQPVTSNHELIKRIKRYHESDHDYFVKRSENFREKKNVASTESIVPSNVSQSRSSLIDLSKQLPARKSSRNHYLQPLGAKKNILETHKPYVVYVKKHDLNGRHTTQQIKKNVANDTLTLSSDVDKVIKNKVVDKIVETKGNDTISTCSAMLPCIPNSSDESLVKLPDEAENNNNDKSMIEKHQTNHVSKEHQEFDNRTNSFISDVHTKLMPNKYMLLDITTKESIRPNTGKSSSVEAERKVENKEEEDEEVDSDELNNDKSGDVVAKQVNNTKIEKHPTPEVSRNHVPISLRMNMPNIGFKVKDNQSSNLFKVQVPNKIGNGFDLDSIYTLPQENDKSDEKEKVIIKDNNYQEVVEFSRTPQCMSETAIHPQINTVQESLAPASYYNNYQDPYTSYQEQPNLNFNDNNQFTRYYPPNEQRTEQINGATEVSYNNYFKLPTSYNSWSYNGKTNFPQTGTYNRMYPYETPALPNLSPKSNVPTKWNTNKDINEPTDDAVRRIWRTWKNVEYDIKSKNVLKQINSHNFYNMATENVADNIKLTQRRYTTT